MTFRNAIYVLLLFFITSGLGANEVQRSPSVDGAEVEFSNLSDGDIVRPTFTVIFMISGMGIAPASVQIDNTGHHHLLINVKELPDFDQPLPYSDNIMHFEKSESEVELELTEGQHTLQLLVTDYAQLPHEPPIISEPITITVSANAPVPVEPENN